MLTALAWLALEVKYLARARDFYEGRLELDPVAESAAEVAYPTGPARLVLRRPDPVPRGGLHVHYAFETPRADYDDWADRLAPLDPDEASFGTYHSLYVDDPDDHCVEVGGRDVDGAGLAGLFEIVLEVEDLARAVATYTALGFEAVDRGSDRPRVRLRGPFDLELWEPHLGLADARGGVHVDLGLVADDPAAAAAAVEGAAGSDTTVVHAPAGPETLRLPDDAVRVRDADGHWLTFLAEPPTDA